MKNAASYGVAKSIDVFAWPNRIMGDAIKEEKHTKQLSHLFGCTTEGIGCPAADWKFASSAESKITRN